MVIAYEGHGDAADFFPPHADALSRVTAGLRVLPGWRKKLGAIERFNDLPGPVHDYLRFIEDFIGVPRQPRVPGRRTPPDHRDQRLSRAVFQPLKRSRAMSSSRAARSSFGASMTYARRTSFLPRPGVL